MTSITRFACRIVLSASTMSAFATIGACGGATEQTGDGESAICSASDECADRRKKDAGAKDSGHDAAGDAGDASALDAGADAAIDSGNDAAAPTAGVIKTVWLVLLENHNLSSILGSSSAPYINGTLVPQGSHATGYVNIPGLHPSEPNYLWLEGGDNFAVITDSSPFTNHQATTDHLVTLLEHAGVTWKAYAEGITGAECPLSTKGLYAPKHVPFVFFDDVTDTNNTASARCIAHVRPYAELAADLAAGTVAQYNFITPDLCDDMHNSTGCTTTDSAKNGDTWLANELPKILGSKAYADGGAVFVTWDESEGGDFPIGMFVMSPFAKAGYANSVHYTHSSTLRTMQTIFGVGPLLRDAANATDLGDLFTTFP